METAVDPSANALSLGEPRVVSSPQSGGDVLAHIDADGSLLWAASTLPDVFGWEPGQLQCYLDLVAPEDRLRLGSLLQGWAARGEAGGVTRFLAKHHDGRRRWAQLQARFLYNRGGPWESVLAICDLGLVDPPPVVLAKPHDDPTLAASTSHEEGAADHGPPNDKARPLGVVMGESEEHYRRLAENATDVVLQTGPDGRLLWVSPSLTELLGWSPDQVLGLRTADLIHPDDLLAAMESMTSILKGGGLEGRIEARFATADGDWRWMSDHGRALLDSEGRIVGGIDALRDIQAEHEAQDAVRLERARLAATLDSMLDPHIVLEPVRDAGGAVVDLRFLDANTSACAYFGRSAAELVGAKMADVVQGALWSDLMVRLRGLVATGAALTCDNEPMGSATELDGRRFDMRGVKVGEAVSFTWRDVTDRFVAARALEMSEARYRLLAENATDVVYRMSPQGVLEWSTRGVHKVLGWTVEQVIGRPALELIDPRDRERAARSIALAGDGAMGSVRLRMLTTAGASRWVEVTANPVRDDQGEVIGLAGGWRDVHAEVQAEQELDRRARTDQLTGLLNRGEVLARLHQVLAHPRRTGNELAVAFCDLDDFKAVNDTLGHGAGDHLLGVVADRIRSSVREGDLVARVGGDEILIVLVGVHDLDEAAGISDKIRRIVAIPVPLPGGAPPARALATTVSIGVTLACDDDDLDALVARADKAMYRAKQGGRDQVVRLDRD